MESRLAAAGGNPMMPKKKKTLEVELVGMLTAFVGETGKSEGAVVVLDRLLKELLELRSSDVGRLGYNVALLVQEHKKSYDHLEHPACGATPKPGRSGPPWAECVIQKLRTWGTHDDPPKKSG